MAEAVVFDLDSTLADTTHRQWMIPYITGEKPSEFPAPTWDTYSMACTDDKPIEATIFLANLLFANNFHVVICTGRSDGARDLTEAWLKEHGVYYHRLYMRPQGDRTPNSIWKLANIDFLQQEGYTVELFVEDFPAVAEAIRERHPSIPVLLVNPGSHQVVAGV